MTQTHSAAHGGRAAARSLAKLTLAARSLVPSTSLASFLPGIDRLVTGTLTSARAGEGA